MSGPWNHEQEDFRIRLRVVYENDTFDPSLALFVERAQELSILEKAYPVAYVPSQDTAMTTKNLWSIVVFIIGSIDSEMIADEDIREEEMEDESMDESQKE